MEPVQLQDTVDIPVSIGFLLGHGASMTCFSTAIDTLRLGNELAEKPLYKWFIYSVDGLPICASNNVNVFVDLGIDRIDHVNALFVCSHWRYASDLGRAINQKIRCLSQRGVVIGGLGDGVLVLAQQGFLDGYRCAAHLSHHAYMSELLPNVIKSEQLYEIDRNRITCGGGVAVVDLFLSLIAKDHGTRLSEAIAESIQVDSIRTAEEQSCNQRFLKIGATHPKLKVAVKEIENNIEHPLQCSELAKRANISLRQLQRLFIKYTGMSPRRFYRECRLHHSRHLIRRSMLPPLEVSIVCGFKSYSQFITSYKKLYGQTPTQERNFLRKH